MEDDCECIQKVHDNFLDIDVTKLPILEAVHCPKTKKVQRLIKCVACPHKFGLERCSKTIWCIYPKKKMDYESLGTIKEAKL